MENDDEKQNNDDKNDQAYVRMPQHAHTQHTQWRCWPMETDRIVTIKQILCVCIHLLFQIRYWRKWCQSAWRTILIFSKFFIFWLKCNKQQWWHPNCLSVAQSHRFEYNKLTLLPHRRSFISSLRMVWIIHIDFMPIRPTVSFTEWFLLVKGFCELHMWQMR